MTPAQDATTLAPCPFCGGSDIMEGVYYADGALEKRGAVRCAGCGVRAPTISWNTRATSQTPDAVREAAEEVCEFDYADSCPELQRDIEALRTALSTPSTSAGPKSQTPDAETILPVKVVVAPEDNHGGSIELPSGRLIFLSKTDAAFLRSTPSSASTPDATALADKWRAEAATHIAAALEEEDIGCDDWFLHRETARIYERCAKELAALRATPQTPDAGKTYTPVGEGDICIDCDGRGVYPSKARCVSCGGTGSVMSGDGIKRSAPTPSASAGPDKCTRCGFPRAEHSYNGACYGSCGEFVSAGPQAEAVAWRTPQTWKAPIETIADLVNNLLTLDQTMNVYGAYHIDFGEDRCRARGLSLSREHVVNDRIKPDESIPYSLVIWTGPEHPQPQQSAGPQADAVREVIKTALVDARCTSRDTTVVTDSTANVLNVVMAALASIVSTPSASTGPQDGWKDDPSADERWQAGCDFAMVQLCHSMNVDPKDVRWDAATETLDGDVSAVIWNILTARMGDNWDPHASAGPQADAVALMERVAELEALINTPETEDFMRAVHLEAAHQRERWGADHDARKAPLDWFWLIGYLAQKATTSLLAGDVEKAKHHTISTAAALSNWHLQIAAHPQPQQADIRPVAHMTYENIEIAFDAWRKTLTVVDRPSNQDIFGQGYVAGWNAKETQLDQQADACIYCAGTGIVGRRYAPEWRLVDEPCPRCQPQQADGRGATEINIEGIIGDCVSIDALPWKNDDGSPALLNRIIGIHEAANQIRAALQQSDGPAK